MKTLDGRDAKFFADQLEAEIAGEEPEVMIPALALLIKRLVGRMNSPRAVMAEVETLLEID